MTKLDLLITLENINYLIESIFDMDPTDLIDKKRKNLDTMRRMLKDSGINPNDIKVKSEEIFRSVKRDIEDGKDPKQISKKIKKGFDDIYKICEVKENSVLYKKLVELSGKKKDENIIKMGLVILSLMVGVLLLNSLCEKIFLLITKNPKLSDVLTCLVTGPIIEEGAKKLAIELGYPWEYTASFANAEMFQYVKFYLYKLATPIRFIVMRLVSILMHHLTTYIQLKYKDENKEKLGFVLAVLTHTIYNWLADKGGEKFIKFKKGFEP